MNLKSISLFFPAYNEEKNISATIANALRVAKQVSPNYEVIIVNDGSTDNTAQVVEEAARLNPNVRVVHHSPNKGYGAALLSGINAARYEYVFFSDGDGQFDLAEITKLIKHTPEYDVVLGYRARRQDNFLRRLNGQAWSWLNRLLFGLKVKDIDCAFKLFKTNLVKNLPVISQGAMLSAELLIVLQNQGVRFKEVAVKHLPRTAGSATGANISVILKAFKEMIRVYLSDNYRKQKI